MPTIILASLIAGAATAHTASTADEPPAAEAVEVVTSCTPPERPASSDYRVAKNLTYRTWPAKKLDIARPATPGSYPVVILLHGGAWIAGTKLTMRAEIERLAVRGFVGVAVSYRLVRGDDSRFPTQLHDVRCALRWLRANAAEYDIDPERAVVLGMSAGGHLAALVATVSEKEIPGPDCSIETPPVTLRGVVTLSAPLDLRPAGKEANRAQEELLTVFLGASPAADPALAARASPAAHVSADTPPFLMAHGQSDHTVPPQQARDMLKALRAVSVPATLIELQGAGHRIVPLSTSKRNQPVTCTILRFLDETLRPATVDRER